MEKMGTEAEEELGNAVEVQKVLGHERPSTDSSEHSGDRSELSHSDSSNDSSSESLEQPSHSPCRGQSTQKRTPAKKQFKHYKDEYRKILNEVIADSNDLIYHETTAPDLETSQLGLSLWTSEQKEAFFQALARYGQHDLPRLAAVTEKSEPEIERYLHSLRLAITELSTNHPEKAILTQEFVPTAVELSDECCHALDQAADGLISMQKDEDAKVEQAKYGEFWLLTQSIAESIDAEIDQSSTKQQKMEDEQVNSDEAGMDQSISSKAPGHPDQRPILSFVPSASLLNLSTFLTLSESIFLNSPINHLRNVRTTPGIYHTAFADFHTLVKTLTTHIVHASVYQAMTRYRALDNRTSVIDSNEHQVFREDVLAALDVLGMKSNAREYWATLPRRLQMKCYRERDTGKHDGSKKREYTRWVPEDEVERYLMNRGTLKRSYPKGQSGKMYEAKADPDGPSSGHSDAEGDVESGAEREDGEARPEKRRRLDDSLTIEQAEAEYLEKIDRQAGIDEEKRLWERLGIPPPTTVNFDDIEIGEPPVRRPDFNMESSDWRLHSRYEPEWMHRPPNGSQ